MGTKRSVKRRPKVAAVVRGEPVVHGVTAAVLEELGRVGYGALRVEDVAARAGVNKTTIYRRWPTKAELVRAALDSMIATRAEPPRTGSLRGDLLAITRTMVEVGCSLEGQGLFRVMLTEGPGSELWAIAESMREAKEAVPRAVLIDAAARGELGPGVDPAMVFDALVCSIHRTLFIKRDCVDDTYLERLVDLLLLGALAPDRRPAARPRPAAKVSAPPPAKPPGRAGSRRRSS